MTKIKDTYSKTKTAVVDLYRKIFTPFRHPILNAKAYFSDMKELDAKGRALKILKAVGYCLAAIGLIVLGIYLLRVVMILAIGALIIITMISYFFGGSLLTPADDDDYDDDDDDELF